eukprot:gene16830-biopygen6790
MRRRHHQPTPPLRGRNSNSTQSAPQRARVIAGGEQRIADVVVRSRDVERRQRPLLNSQSLSVQGIRELACIILLFFEDLKIRDRITELALGLVNE